MSRGADIILNIGRALVPALFIFGTGIASAAEPPAVRSAIEARGADYRRQDPGVPLWPSTCDCISVAFGFRDSSGYRPVRFRFADAVDYYGQASDSMSKMPAAASLSKGPRKELVAEEAPQAGDMVTGIKRK